MFLGHVAVGLAAKKFAPKTSLLWLVGAPSLLDLLWPVFLALGVTSHWVFDWVSHRPDMPLAPWSGAKAGLGLWNSVPATLGVESLLYGLGLWLYVRTTKPSDATGRWAFVAFAAFLGAVYLGNVFGPPPPNVPALTAVTFTLFLVPLWAGWFDRHRALRA